MKSTLAFTHGQLDRSEFKGLLENYGIRSKFLIAFSSKDKDLWKALNELKQSDPEKLFQLYDNLIDSIQNQGSKKEREWANNQISKLSSTIQAQGYEHPSQPSAKQPSAVDLDSKRNALEAQRLNSTFQNVSKAGGNFVGDSLKTFYDELDRSGNAEGEKAAAQLVADINDIFSKEESADKIKESLENLVSELGTRIPEALDEEHKKLINDMLEQIKNNKDIEAKISTQPVVAEDASNEAAMLQKNINSLYGDISRLREAASEGFSFKTHTNDLIARGGGIGMQTVDASNSMKQLNAILEIKNKLNEIKNLQSRNSRFFQAY